VRPPETIPVEELVPHRQPTLMIDGLLEASTERGIASKMFRLLEYGVCGDLVCETALVECVAQTAAAFLGYGQLASPLQEELGFLVGLSSFSFARRPQIGELLLIEARLEKRFEEIFMVKGRVFASKISGECIAEGKLKIYLKNAKKEE